MPAPQLSWRYGWPRSIGSRLSEHGRVAVECQLHIGSVSADSFQIPNNMSECQVKQIFEVFQGTISVNFSIAFRQLHFLFKCWTEIGVQELFLDHKLSH